MTAEIGVLISGFCWPFDGLYYFFCMVHFGGSGLCPAFAWCRTWQYRSILYARAHFVAFLLSRSTKCILGVGGDDWRYPTAFCLL